MANNFNLNLLAETQPSICIPRVFNNIAEKKIRQVFDELNLGKISRIDIKERKNEKGEVFNRVYIHFEKWFCNEDAQTARRKLILGKEIKIIYDKPWFWKVSASKWEPPKRCDNLSQKQVKSSSSVYIKYDEEDEEFGRSLHLSDLNTDEFGRSLHLSDLNTDEFGLLSDLNISTHEFKKDLSLGDLNISTDEFGRDLSLSDLNISTDEFGRDLSLKRDYEERRRIELINNFRPINRRLNDRRLNDRRLNDRRANDRRTNDRRLNDRRSNDRRSNDRRAEPVKEPEEPEEEERKLRPFISVDEDVDNLNIPKFEIDYGTPLIVPKINRKIIKKKINTKTVPKPQINWYDDDSDDDNDTNDTDVFLTEVFNKISINDIRPRSPDYPPPKNQEEEEEFDIYADLDLDL
jgi:hypothetical protein